MIDLSVARMVHLDYEARLEEAVRSGRVPVLTATRIDVSHHECELGRWLNRHGSERYREHLEILALNTWHKRFHIEAERSLRLVRSGQMREAAESLRDVRSASKEVIYLLTQLEYHLVQRSHGFKDLLDKPVRLLGRLIGR
ncbi:CZB domain-containing protein [Magnetofaba australis]|uniref:Putative methyl-accepting chemotaxis protein n=1 Tax=Magnetofaba australis IT-1 TaxID=1434232 RepID=W0LN69_9PROT|nr:CZB domain-containing protein [Magnetofaba australis]AHG23897.1 hypothetical protein MIIT1_02804 [Magnetofaba australis IT-1]OSM08644.1 putative methyl-accepting chemotaxis protein [Magnetofaba australis IT-1]